MIGDAMSSQSPDIDGLAANAAAMDRLLTLANELRRTNQSKRPFTLVDWQRMVTAVLDSRDAHTYASQAASEVIRAAHSDVRRLANSGEARMWAKRDPDSSLVGRRFYDDLDAAQARLAKLRSLIQTMTQPDR